MNGPRSTLGSSRPTRQFLVHIDADLIRQVKILAIDRNMTASRLVQEAIVSFLSPAAALRAAAAPGEAP